MTEPKSVLVRRLRPWTLAELALEAAISGERLRMLASNPMVKSTTVTTIGNNPTRSLGYRP